MINGLIAIGGTMLGIITGFILGRISRTQNTVLPDPSYIPPAPKIVEEKHQVELIRADCDFPKPYMLNSEDEIRDAMLKTLSYDIALQIHQNRSKYIEYKVEEDYRMNRIVAHGVLRVVKNT